MPASTRVAGRRDVLRLQTLAGNAATTAFVQGRTPRGEPTIRPASRGAAVVQRAPGTPGSATSPRARPDEMAQALSILDGMYENALSLNTAMPDTRRIDAFLDVAYTPTYRSEMWTEMYRRLQDVGVDYNVAVNRWLAAKEKDLVDDWLATSPAGFEIWQEVAANHASQLASGEGRAFADRVQGKVLRGHARFEAKRLGIPSAKLQSIADTQVRPLIKDQLTMLIAGAVEAIGVWTGIPMPRKHQRVNKSELGAASFHFASEMAEVLFDHRSLIVKYGIPGFAIAKFGLELFHLWDEKSEKEEEERKQELRRDYEGEAKTALIEMFNRLDADIRRELDVLSVESASSVVGSGIDAEGPDKKRLETAVRRQVFGENAAPDLPHAFERAKDQFLLISTTVEQRFIGAATE
jgi:hypothetical protein